MAKKDDPICFKHDEIIEICDEVKTLKLLKIKERQRLMRLINRIEKVASWALEDGQNMENRLRQYHNGIVGLGFSRVKLDKGK